MVPLVELGRLKCSDFLCVCLGVGDLVNVLLRKLGSDLAD